MESDAVAAARRVAKTVVRRFAREVNRDNRFPAEAIEGLRQTGLLGLLVPKAAGGIGGRFSDACEIAVRLGYECTSTAMVWCMHSQQVAIMADHASCQWRVLSQIATKEALSGLDHDRAG